MKNPLIGFGLAIVLFMMVACSLSTVITPTPDITLPPEGTAVSEVTDTPEPEETDEPTQDRTPTSRSPEPSPTATPEPTGTETLEPLGSPSVHPTGLAESSLTPSAAFTGTATETPTRTPTVNPFDFTPTRIADGGTPPVEITPLGGGGSGDGEKPDGELPDGTVYLTTANLNLRSSPEVKSGNVIRLVPAGFYPAYDLVQSGNDDWVRICQRDKVPSCGYLAQFVGDQRYGVLMYSSPLTDPIYLSITASEIGGGGTLGMELNLDLLLTLLLTLAAMVPVLGGSAGLIVGLIVDVIKAVLIWQKKELTPGMFGILAIVINAIVWIGLFIILRAVPAETLPENVDQWFKIAATVLTFVLTFLTQLKASGFSHGVLVDKAPLVFSVTEHNRVELLKDRGVDPEVAVFASG